MTITPSFLVEVATYAVGSPKEYANCNAIATALKQDLISYRDHHCDMGTWRSYCLTYKGFEYLQALHPKYYQAAKEVMLYNLNHSVELIGEQIWTRLA